MEQLQSDAMHVGERIAEKQEGSSMIIEGSLGLQFKNHPVEEPAMEHYVETLTFDPDTGLCTTSAEPATEQLMPVDQQSDNVKADPDHVERKVNNSHSRRKMTSVTGSRQGTPHRADNSKVVCFKCGHLFAGVSWIP